MKNKTREYMEKHQMTASGDGVLVGLSGGADSVCLLHLLWCLRTELGISLRALHVHHGLRGEEADRDARFSQSFCKQLGIPIQEKRIFAAQEAKEAGISVEEAGRAARYRLLEEEAERWEAEEGIIVHLAVAHHGNDNAETILHHLFRGSGLKGLAGIPPVRERIIRPLLWAEKESLLAYLKEQQLSWVEDSTNQENDYTRNRIRHELLPLAVREINVQAVSNILRAGERLRQADSYMEQQAERWLEAHGTLSNGSRSACAEKRRMPVRKDGLDAGEKEREYVLDISAMLNEEELLQSYLVRGALKAISSSLKDLTARHIEEVLSLLKKETGKQLMLPHGILVRKEYGRLYLQAGLSSGSRQTGRVQEESSACPEENAWLKKERKLLEEEAKGQSSHWKTRIFFCENPAEFPKNQYTKWFDYDKIKGTILLRTRRQGDYITLSGGGRKTVKSYMIDAKIPREQRERIPLLAEDSHILWIAGYRISEYYKVTAQTKTVLEVQFDGGYDSGE